jgi:hypothetical protein
VICQGSGLRRDSLSYLTGAESKADRPLDVGRKFDVAGAVLPFAGNTFICHVPQNSPAHAALTGASLALQAGSVGGAFRYLPPSSFHMTVFEGVCDVDRNADTDRWPVGIRRDASVPEVSHSFEKACRTLVLAKEQRIRPTGIFGGCSVAISGRTPLAEASLRHTRRLLRNVTGIHRTDFKTYDFHITLAYPLRWLTEGEAVAVVDLSDRVFTRLSEQIAHITLGPVEFCTFDHMHAFFPLVVLDGQSGTKLRGCAQKSVTEPLPSKADRLLESYTSGGNL